MRKIKCINNDGGKVALQVGRIYRVVKETNEYIYVPQNSGGFYKWRFVEVLGLDDKEDTPNLVSKLFEEKVKQINQ